MPYLSPGGKVSWYIFYLDRTSTMITESVCPYGVIRTHVQVLTAAGETAICAKFVADRLQGFNIAAHEMGSLRHTRRGISPTSPFHKKNLANGLESVNL